VQRHASGSASAGSSSLPKSALKHHANAALNFQREKIMTQIFDRAGGAARRCHLFNKIRRGRSNFQISEASSSPSSQLLMTRLEIVNHVY
jgi:hypothetical protein